MAVNVMGVVSELENPGKWEKAVICRPVSERNCWELVSSVLGWTPHS